MSKRDSAPTHGWVISSTINKWLALGFMVIVFFVFMVTVTITYSLRRDCFDVYNRDLSLGSYWLHIEAGSNDPGCPGNRNVN